jgi:diketogulonate reductase-like aldo/keto reductase
MDNLPTVALPDGARIPVLGIGTWNMAVKPAQRANEIAALQAALDLDMTVIDTAEMYGDGAAEILVAEAIGHRRSDAFLVSKVLPQHATRRGTISACEASLRRLKTDRLDMYLLHWRGGVPLDETLHAFRVLQRDGKIRYWGVSNFDADDMEELAELTTTGGAPVATNQVLYNLKRRGIEYDLLPWCRNHGIAVMAYSPLEQGLLAKHATLKSMGERLDATPAQIALAWILRQPGVMVIPKAGHVERVRENRGALDIDLTPELLLELDTAFPPPKRKIALEMI